MKKYYLYNIKNKKYSVDEEKHEVIKEIIRSKNHQLIMINNGDDAIYTGDIKGWELDEEKMKLEQIENMPQIEALKYNGQSSFQQALKAGKEALYKKMGW